MLLEVTPRGARARRHPGPQPAAHPDRCVRGRMPGEYGYLSTTDLGDVDSWSGTGGALSIIANRVSYYFDLRGPSMTIDTACSSSLVTIHLACQSLRAGDSDVALAAGVNMVLSPAVTRSFDQLEAMSKTGQCHAFDAAADGIRARRGLRRDGPQAPVRRPA
ncbi:MAG: beta-ketoacyl synthase N-terminal-like domain-containing protein [Mycobacterium kyogaense]